MTDYYEQQLNKNKEEHDQDVEAIRSDRDLSEEAKARKIGEVHTEAVEEHRRLMAEQNEAKASELERARRKALGAPHIDKADPALVSMSYRDALSKVSQAQNPEELGRMLEQASWTNDKALARAVLYRGYQLQSRPVIDAYFKAYPGERGRWDSFMDAAEAANKHEKQRRLFGTIPPQRPREIG